MNDLFSKETYQSRRHQLKAAISSGVIVFMGNGEMASNYLSNTYPFRQDSSFLYFFGLELPNLVGVIDIDNDEEILFGTDFELEDIIWMGEQPTVQQLAAKTGVHKTAEYSKLVDYLRKNKKRQIHYTKPYRDDVKMRLSEGLDISAKEVDTQVSVALCKAIVALRSVKSSEEIEAMEKASTIGALMHSTAMQYTRVGRSERDLFAMVEKISWQYGNGVSFPSIISQRGETLHNHDHDDILQEGKLLLIDAGVETKSRYCSDHTRTFPVNGKFTACQKDLYEIVLAGNLQGIKMSKPHILYKDVHFEVSKILAEGLKNIGLMKGNIEDAVIQGAHALFFPHGLGHQIGMDVHDMENIGEDYVGYDEHVKRSELFGYAGLRMGRSLQEGYTLTVEPGIYFIPQLIKQWKIEQKYTDYINYDKVDSYLHFGGIRIEDSILITKNGSKVLGQSLPKTVEALEMMIGTK